MANIDIATATNAELRDHVAAAARDLVAANNRGYDFGYDFVLDPKVLETALESWDTSGAEAETLAEFLFAALTEAGVDEMVAEELVDAAGFEDEDQD